LTSAISQRVLPVAVRFFHPESGSLNSRNRIALSCNAYFSATYRLVLRLLREWQKKIRVDQGIWGVASIWVGFRRAPLRDAGLFLGCRDKP